MKLKQGTPVWYKGQLTYIDAVHDTLILRCNQLTVKECTKDITPLTKQEYIRHVMVPDGWLCDNDNTCHKYYNGSYEEKRVIINFSGNEAYLYIEDDMPFIDDVLFDIIKQGRAHLNKLNLLKELEN